MLLNKIYKKIKINIYIAVNNYTYLNYIIDNSLNISYKKVSIYLLIFK